MAYRPVDLAAISARIAPLLGFALAGLLAKAAAPAGIEAAPLTVVAPSAINRELASHPGPTVVLLTSYDERCPFCIRANPKYLELAHKLKGRARVVLAHYEPWPSVGNDNFARGYDINGLPYALLLVDGVRRGAAAGDVSLAQMEDQLLAEWSGQPAAKQGLADGAELVGKIDNVKLLAAPKSEAKTTAMLSRRDGVVYLGEEKDNFLKVSTDQGEGWVDKRLLKPR